MPQWARVYLWAMALKWYCTFQSWSLTIRLFNVTSRTLIRGSYPSEDMQSVFSTAPDEWSVLCVRRCQIIKYFLNYKYQNYLSSDSNNYSVKLSKYDKHMKTTSKPSALYATTLQSVFEVPLFLLLYWQTSKKNSANVFGILGKLIAKDSSSVNVTQ